MTMMVNALPSTTDGAAVRREGDRVLLHPVHGVPRLMTRVFPDDNDGELAPPSTTDGAAVRRESGSALRRASVEEPGVTVWL